MTPQTVSNKTKARSETADANPENERVPRYRALIGGLILALAVVGGARRRRVGPGLPTLTGDGSPGPRLARAPRRCRAGALRRREGHPGAHGLRCGSGKFGEQRA